jgi:hypothetical protein
LAGLSSCGAGGGSTSSSSTAKLSKSVSRPSSVRSTSAPSPLGPPMSMNPSSSPRNSSSFVARGSGAESVDWIEEVEERTAASGAANQGASIEGSEHKES